MDKDKLDSLINELREVDAKLEFLLQQGSNDETLVDKKRELTNKILDLKKGL